MRLLEHPYRSYDHLRCVCDRTAPLGAPLWGRVKLETPSRLVKPYYNDHGEMPKFFPWLIRYAKVTCTVCGLTMKGYGERNLGLEIDDVISRAMREGYSILNIQHLNDSAYAFITIAEPNAKFLSVAGAPTLFSILSFSDSRLQLWTPLEDA